MAVKSYIFHGPKTQRSDFKLEVIRLRDANGVIRDVKIGDSVQLDDAVVATFTNASFTEGVAPPAPAASNQGVTSPGLGIGWLEIAGHSLAAGGGARIAPHGGYAHKLAKALGIPNIHDYSIGGAIACAPQKVATGDGGYPWILRQAIRPGSPGHAAAAGAPYIPASQLVLCHFGLNDLGELGAAKPLPFQTALRTILARFCAACVFEVAPAAGGSDGPQWAFTGTWASLGLADFNASCSGDGIRYTLTPGDKTVFTTPDDFPANRVVGIGLWLNNTYGTLTYGVKIDGQTMPDLVLNVPTLTDSATGAHIVHTVRFGTGNPGDPYGAKLGAGAHTIEISFKSTNPAGGSLAIDFAHIEADPQDGPVLICPLPNKPATYGIWGGWPGGASMNDAVVDAWKDHERQVLAEFPGRVIGDSHGLGIDLDYSGMNRYTLSPGTALPPAGTPADFAPDGAHPNERGHGTWVDFLDDIVRSSPLITDRLRSRPFVDPRPRSWKKAGMVNTGGAFSTGWSNLANLALPDMAWRIDNDRRVFVRGTIKAAAGATGTILPSNTLPKPYALVSKVGNQYDGVAFSQRPMRVGGGIGGGAPGQFTNGGAVTTAAGNFIEFDFDYQAEM